MKAFAAAMLVLTILSAPAGAQVIAGAPTLSDPDLAQIRGGFELPGGIVVTLGVTTDTHINGQEVLRTVFSVRDGTPQLSVFGRGSNGVAPVDVRVDGAGVATADGVVRLRSVGDSVRAELASDAVTVSHLLGQSLGSVVANSGSNRSIDVDTTVDIGLSGVRPDTVGSSMARVDNLALGSTALLAR